MDTIPDDVILKLKAFNDALTEFEDGFEDFLNISYAKPQRPALEKARHDLTSLFALNSLYWTFQACSGKQPKDQEDLAIELKRVKEYMGRLKKFDDLHLRPTVNARGAKAFVRNALFDLHAARPLPLQKKAAETSLRTKHIGDEDGEAAKNEDWNDPPAATELSTTPSELSETPAITTKALKAQGEKNKSAKRIKKRK